MWKSSSSRKHQRVSVTKRESAFVGPKINIPFDFATKDKRRMPVRCLIDTGACTSVLPLTAVKCLGFGESDLRKGVGEPETLSGFNEVQRTLWAPSSSE